MNELKCAADRRVNDNVVFLIFSGVNNFWLFELEAVQADDIE